jgi:hypothetical protein
VAPAPSTTLVAVAYPVVPVSTRPAAPLIDTAPTVDVSEQTLPRTGSNAASGLMRWADAGFMLGVALIAVTSLVPRRTTRGG